MGIRRQKNMSLLVALIMAVGSIFAVPSSSFGWTNNVSANSLAEESSISLGTEMSQTVYKMNSNSKNNMVYKLEANPKNQHFKLKSGLAGDALYGREKTTSQANRVSREGYRVVGAVNGDFYNFATGNPIGSMVSEGEIITTSNDWKGFGITDSGEAMIGTPRFAINFGYDGKTAIVNNINRDRTINNLILYTPKQGSSTKTNEHGTEVVLRVKRGTVASGTTLKAEVESIVDDKGDARLERGKLVLSGHGIARQHLKGLRVGQEVDLSFSAQGNWHNAVEVVGGKDILVQDGNIQPNLEKDRHPRTALGVKSNGNIIAVVVDGRQAGYSEGVGLDELAKMMVDMGAVQAINLDGGGSSTFATRGMEDRSVSVVNRVSDGSERAVANSVLFISTDEEAFKPEIPDVSVDELVLESFEGSDHQWEASGVNYNSKDVGLVKRSSGEPVYLGDGSLKVAYDFTDKTGTSGIYAGTEKDIEIPGRPKKIGMWVNGDGNGHWLRGQLRDRNNNAINLDFTSMEAGVDWKGWRYVQAEIPAETYYPLSLDLAVRYMKTKEGSPDRGAIYIDNIKAIYNDNLGTVPEEPELEEELIFSDMKSHWSRDNIETLYSRGIISGLKRDDGRLIFSPDKSITRQEFAKLIVESEKLEVKIYDNLSDFSDIGAIDDWAKPYVSTAYKAGLIQGLADDAGSITFNPKAPVTKSQIATIIGRAIDGDMQGEVLFKDNDKIPEWAKKHVMMCAQKGIVNGTPDGYFEGEKSATRAESAVMIYRLLSNK